MLDVDSEPLPPFPDGLGLISPLKLLDRLFRPGPWTATSYGIVNWDWSLHHVYV